MNKLLLVSAFAAKLFCSCQPAQALEKEWWASLWAPGANIPVCWISPGFDSEKATTALSSIMKYSSSS